MPALQPIPGIARVVVNQALGGVAVVNVFHVKSQLSTLPMTQADLDALALVVRNSWVARFIPLQSSQLTLGNVTATDLGGPLGLQGAALGTTPGAIAGAYLSAGSAAGISWKIPRRYRGGHIRTYMGGVVQAQLLNANTWSAAFVTSLAAAGNGLRTDIPANTAGLTNPFALVGLHRTSGGATLTPPEYEFVTLATVDTRVDSQRRRLGRDR